MLKGKENVVNMKMYLTEQCKKFYLKYIYDLCSGMKNFEFVFVFLFLFLKGHFKVG